MIIKFVGVPIALCLSSALLEGCVCIGVPVVIPDYSGLSDNIVDSAIKTWRDNVPIYVASDRDWRTDRDQYFEDRILSLYTVSSDRSSVVTYLKSIGASCDNLNAGSRGADKCDYQVSWPIRRTDCEVDNKISAITTATVLMTIAYTDNRITEITAAYSDHAVAPDGTEYPSPDYKSTR